MEYSPLQLIYKISSKRMLKVEAVCFLRRGTNLRANCPTVRRCWSLQPVRRHFFMWLYRGPWGWVCDAMVMVAWWFVTFVSFGRPQDGKMGFVLFSCSSNFPNNIMVHSDFELELKVSSPFIALKPLQRLGMNESQQNQNPSRALDICLSHFFPWAN